MKYIAKNSSLSLWALFLTWLRKKEDSQQTVFAYARAALIVGLKAYDIKKSDIILIPDFICDVVPNELKHHQFSIMYYAVNEDLTPCHNQIEDFLSTTSSIKALMIINYFGIGQKVDFYRNYCDERGLIFIEDNAHGFGSRFQNNILGEVGDISITSVRKVLPIFSGAILHLNILHQPQKFHSIIVNPIKIKIKIFLKSILYCCYNISKILKIFPHYEDKMAFKEVVLDDFLLADIYSISYITKNIQMLSINQKHRYELYLVWENFAKMQGLTSVFVSIDNGSAPMCYPCYAKNNLQRDEWIEWGRKECIDIYTWPRLPDEFVEKNDEVIRKWEKLICFPINININIDLLKKRLDYFCGC